MKIRPREEWKRERGGERANRRMMIGNYPDPAVHVPPWTFPDDLTVDISTSPNAEEHYSLHRYLPSNDTVVSDSEAYACEQFRMFEFKVRKCTRGGSHDWTECPFAHPGEKARRRDPRKYHYSGTACAEFRKGGCRKGDLCEFAHGVFECWLHPARYRTQPCKDGIDCRRRVCFFAHTRDQLRVLSPNSPLQADSYDGSPRRLALDSVSPLSDSPPLSPVTNSLGRTVGINSVNEIVASLRQLQLNKINSCPLSWGVNSGLNLGSPCLSVARTQPLFSSLPSTPTGVIRALDMWDKSGDEEGGPVMERVESGRNLRVKMFEKLSRENPLDHVDTLDPVTSSGSDDRWASKLFK